MNPTNINLNGNLNKQIFDNENQQVLHRNENDEPQESGGR